MPYVLPARYKELIQSEIVLRKQNDRIVNMYNYKTNKKINLHTDDYIHKEGDLYGPDLTCNSDSIAPPSTAFNCLKMIEDLK